MTRTVRRRPPSRLVLVWALTLVVAAALGVLGVRSAMAPPAEGSASSVRPVPSTPAATAPTAAPYSSPGPAEAAGPGEATGPAEATHGPRPSALPAPEGGGSGGTAPTAPPEPRRASELPWTTTETPESGGGMTPEPAGGTLEPLELGTPASGGASAVGETVAGFPVLVGVPDGARVLSTDLASDGPRVRMTLDAVGGHVDDVVAFYLTTLVDGLGFVAAPVASSPGTTALAFTRPEGALLLSVRPEGPGSRFSVAGTLTGER